MEFSHKGNPKIRCGNVSMLNPVMRTQAETVEVIHNKTVWATGQAGRVRPLIQEQLNTLQVRMLRV
jgi:hypothetical protein